MKEIFENTEVISNSDESIQDYIINSDEVRPGDIELISNSDESYEDIENTFNNKAWYILPVILKNKVLTDKSNINNIEYCYIRYFNYLVLDNNSLTFI